MLLIKFFYKGGEAVHKGDLRTGSGGVDPSLYEALSQLKLLCVWSPFICTLSYQHILIVFGKLLYLDKST